MDLGKLAEQERYSKKYADDFFEEEREMEGIFKIDIKILDSLMTKKGRVLDVAMGPGRHVKHFSGKGFEVWGNDFNRHMVAAAKKRVKSRKVRFTNNDMRALLGIKSGYFDYVLCMGASLGSIYRESERQKAVSEMARAAKKNGLVFIHAHNLFEVTEFADVLNLLIILKNNLMHPRAFDLGDVVYHHSDSFKRAYLHWFTPSELRRLMARAGLTVVKEFYLKGPDQDRIMPENAFLKGVRSGGFVFVGKKV